MRESIAIDDEGRLIEPPHVATIRLEEPDPDLYSYDSDIRQRFLNNPEEAEADQETRPWELSFVRLGYPIIDRSEVYLVHSFEQRFGVNIFSDRESSVIIKASLAVASLSSYLDDNRLFTCSGTVIESTGGISTIVTSASLVALTNGDGHRTVAKNAKIHVRFPVGGTYDACLVGCCLHYNVAFITIQREHQDDILPLLGKGIESESDIVFALGCHYVCQEPMAAIGETIHKRNKFDCVELLFSSCKITKCGIGGPLLNSRGDFVGVNFYDIDDTPYLPSSLVLGCWEQIKTHRFALHLRFGWRIRPLGQHLKLRDTTQKDFNLTAHDLAIEEVAEGSPACDSGTRNGDIVLELFDEPVSKYATVLLDKSKFLSDENGVRVQVKTLRQSDHSLAVDATKLSSCGYNRWPLPEPEWRVARS